MNNKNKNQNGLWLLIFVLVALVFVFWFYSDDLGNFLFIPSEPVNSLQVNSNPKKNIEILRSELFSSLNNFQKYGQWPLMAVPLSENRGDPFSAKR